MLEKVKYVYQLNNFACNKQLIEVLLRSLHQLIPQLIADLIGRVTQIGTVLPAATLYWAGVTQSSMRSDCQRCLIQHQPVRH